MNHPNREELAGFLYQELTREESALVADHLKGCMECQAEVKAWRAVRRELKGWQLPAPARQRAQAPAAWLGRLKLASAAAALVCAGFALARFNEPRATVDTVALRAELRQELRQDMQAELASFGAEQAKRQQDYEAALARTLGQLEALRLVDYVSLRKDVETVAVRAEDELQTTRQGLLHLARLEQ
jgi:hypothetical protein